MSKIKVEFRTDKLAGHRDTPISEVLPPDLYEKVKSPKTAEEFRQQNKITVDQLYEEIVSTTSLMF